MGIEIERKFLIDTTKLPQLGEGTALHQGYLSRRPAVRIRATPKGAWLTIKGPGTLKRQEFEYPIPAADAQQMLELCYARLSKHRYRLPFQGHIWEVDEFLGMGAFWLAEIELTTADESFEKPPWLGLEVTGDPHYTNIEIAEFGPPGRAR
jgi:adenylate cyclase